MCRAVRARSWASVPGRVASAVTSGVSQCRRAARECRVLTAVMSLVGKGQSLRFAGPDVDFSEKQPGDGLASAVVALAVGADRVGGDVLSGIKSA